jgi:SAM-dependent methyltransferase
MNCGESAESIRSQLESGFWDPQAFRAALLNVPSHERDAWVDRVLGLHELPEDGPELPRGCVPYLPCSVNALLAVVEHAPVQASDVFVDVGSGLGRAAAFVHLLTGAGAIGVEVQSRLVDAARDLAARFSVSRLSFIEGDAIALTGTITIGSVFFLYCPFSGERLAKVLGDLEAVARTRTIRICCVDLSLPSCEWLTHESSIDGVAIYRSNTG